MNSIRMNGRAGAAVAACLLTLVCFAAARAQATTSVTGQVTDKTGAGLPGATVTLYPRERPTERLETVTDAGGQYRFERVAPGEYLVEAKGTGFARSAALPLRVESGANPALDISLEVAGIREEVVVTASGTAQTVDEVSKAVTVVDQRESDERDEYSVAAALQTAPALRVAQLGGPGAAVEIRARGLGPQDTAVLVDGLRLRDATAEQGGAQTLLGSLLLTDTDRVEVLRGSGSSLYGSNAVGGVINIVSNEGGGPTHGEVLLEYGSLDYARGRVRVAGGLGRGDRVVYSMGLSYVNVSKGIDGNDAWHNLSAHSRFAFRFTPRATLSARLYSADAFAMINNRPESTLFYSTHDDLIKAVPITVAELRRLPSWPGFNRSEIGGATYVPDSDDPDEAKKTRFFDGALVYTAQPSETLSYTLSYQAVRTSHIHTDGPGLSLFPLFPEYYYGNLRVEEDGLIRTLGGRADFRVGRSNFITAGYEAEHEKYAQGDYGAFRGSYFETDTLLDVTQFSHSLFAQDQLSFLDNRLRLSASFRAQFFSLGHVHFRPQQVPYPRLLDAPPGSLTGDASVAYFFERTRTKLRAHAGNGQRAPSLSERFAAYYAVFCVGPFCSPYWEAVGNPYVRPELSVAFDAGVDQSLFGNRLRATATYFYTSVRRAIKVWFNSIYDQSFPVERPLYDCYYCYLNTRGTLARGVELSLTAAPTRSLDIFAAYTYTNSDERLPTFEHLRAQDVSDHQFSLVASQRLGRRVLLNFDFVAASSYTAWIPYNLLTYVFDGQVKADFAASYTQPISETKSVRCFVKVENISDRVYYERGYRTPGRTIAAGMAFRF